MSTRQEGVLPPSSVCALSRENLTNVIPLGRTSGCRSELEVGTCRPQGRLYNLLAAQPIRILSRKSGGDGLIAQIDENLACFHLHGMGFQIHAGGRTWAWPVVKSNRPLCFGHSMRWPMTNPPER